jgi:hypothetical protein
MSAKNIEIRMIATGAAQAAAEVRKSEEAISDLNEATQAASKNAKQLDENVSDIARVATAKAVGDLADMAGQLGSKFVETAQHVEGFDQELANTLRNAGAGIQKVSSGVESMAAGFAVGGPLGAGLAGIGVLIGEAVNAWAEMEQAQANAEESGRRAIEMAEKLARARATYALDVQNDGVLERLEEEADVLQEQVEKMTRLREVERSREKADEAERDFQDDEAIRNGADPEAVRIQRAKDDAEKAKANADQEVEDARLKKEVAAKKAQAAFFQESRVSQNPDATDKERKDAADAAEKTRSALEKADDEFRVATAKAANEKRAITARTANEVRELEERQLDRFDREQRRKEQENNRMLRDQGVDDGLSGRSNVRSYRGDDDGLSGRSNVRSFPGDDDDGNGKPSTGTRRKSMIEDSRERAEARQADRDRRSNARQRDREERGGREEGSLELIRRADSAASNAGKGGSGEIAGALDRLLSALESSSGKSGGGDDLRQLIRRIEIVESQIKYNRRA